MTYSWRERGEVEVVVVTEVFDGVVSVGVVVEKVVFGCTG